RIAETLVKHHSNSHNSNSMLERTIGLLLDREPKLVDELLLSLYEKQLIPADSAPATLNFEWLHYLQRSGSLTRKHAEEVIEKAPLMSILFSNQIHRSAELLRLSEAELCALGEAWSASIHSILPVVDINLATL